MIYAKFYQRVEVFNFYAMDDNRVPVVVEVVCFLNQAPSISYNEYDSNKASDLIEVEAIPKHYQQITKGNTSERIAWPPLASLKPTYRNSFRQYHDQPHDQKINYVN